MLDEETVDILEWLDNTEPARPIPQLKSAHSTSTLTSTGIAGTSFEIQREVLLNLLERAVGVVPNRDMVPVYTNFQFQVDSNLLTVTATSGETTIVLSTSQIDVKMPGIEVFPARTLLAIVKETNAESTVFIEVTNTGAVIVAGGYSVEIKLADGRDFPRSDRLDDVVFHQVNRKNFVDSVTSVKYALPGRDYSGQDSLKMINIKGGKFTACDGARFQQVRIDGFKLNMQLPMLCIPNLLKVLTSSDQELLEIGETKFRLVFRLGTAIFYVNKKNDPYPNVEQLWLRPALSNDQELLVNKSELITAIKQVRIAADSNQIGLALTENSITVIAKDINNSASTVISCKWAGKPKNIVVNYVHLAETLKAYKPEECRFMLGEDTKTHKAPILLKDDDTMSIATIAQMLASRLGLPA